MHENNHNSSLISNKNLSFIDKFPSYLLKHSIKPSQISLHYRIINKTSIKESESWKHESWTRSTGSRTINKTKTKPKGHRNILQKRSATISDFELPRAYLDSWRDDLWRAGKQKAILKNNIIKVYFTRTNETQRGHVGTQYEKIRSSCTSYSGYLYI